MKWNGGKNNQNYVIIIDFVQQMNSKNESKTAFHGEPLMIQHLQIFDETRRALGRTIFRLVFFFHHLNQSLISLV